MSHRVTICLIALLTAAGPARAAEPEQPEALALYARGEYQAVVARLEPVYRAGGAGIQERLLLARAFLHVDRRDDGMAVLESVLQTDAENPEANALFGRALHEAGRHAEAVEYLEHALRLRADPATAGTLGQCFYALGERLKAKVHLQKALAQDIRNPANSFLLGRICLEQGAGALAEEYLLTAQEAGMDSPELHLLLGRACLLQRKYIGPVMVRRILSSPQPGRIVDGHLVLGGVNGVPDQYMVCTRFCALYQGSVVLATDPRQPDALFMAARGWLAAGRTERAAATLKRLTEVEPDSTRTVGLSAEVLLAAGDFQALDQLLAAAHEKGTLQGGSVADFHYRAALALRAHGKRDDAIGLLKKAERHAPTDGKVLRSLAGLCAAGRDREAEGYYARMVELFPDAPDIDELRRALEVLREKREARP